MSQMNASMVEHLKQEIANFQTTLNRTDGTVIEIGDGIVKAGLADVRSSEMVEFIMASRA